jgi:AraC-like DNA-binding protein
MTTAASRLIQPGAALNQTQTHWEYAAAPETAPQHGVWRLQQSTEAPGIVRFVPDLCVHLVFDLAGTIDVEPFLLHPALHYLDLPLPAGSILVGIQYAVWAGLPLLETQIDAPGTYSVRFDLDWANLIYFALLDQRNALRTLNDALQHLARFDAWVDSSLRNDYDRHFLTRASAEPAQSDTVLEYSERQQRRLYQELVGLSPSQFRRIARFQQSFNLLLSHGSSAAVLAQCDFADQAHFIREFKAFTGLTPRQCIARFRT